MTITQLPVSGEQRDPQTQSEHPEPGRWVPSRAGVLNVWRYYDEVFEFHNGRLLLRGPNGTGKSKALELLLPYLFDANLRPHRLSTFGSGERTMWWNLMGEGATGATRVGYVWLEFHRDGASGPEWFCCGARLQASKHTKSPTADYFTTSRRIGGDGVALCNESGAPLGKAALTEELGEHGRVHPNAGDYRTTVRQTLFPELTEQRFDALITALLQLRQPKLSERLDPALLSNLLSQALPPLGEAEISELAEGFERLDRQREQLRELDEEADAAGSVASRQQTYAQRVLRDAAATLTSATSRLESLSETARGSAGEYQQAVREHEDAEQRKKTSEVEVARLESRISGLTQSEEYEEGARLDELRRQATSAEQHAARAREQAAAAQRTAEQDAQRAEEAGGRERSAAEAATTARDDTARAAHRGDLDSAREELDTALESGGRATPLLRAAVRNKGDRITAVRTAIEDVESARRRRSEAEDELETARARLSQADDERGRCRSAHESAVDAQTERLRGWASGTVELRFDDVEALTACAESEPAVLAIVNPTAEAVTRSLAGNEATVTARREATQRERDELAEQLTSLRSQAELPPEPPRTRTADRSRLDGAPLWRLVSFATGVTEVEQSAVEAALQASGLLDAFVPTSGAVELSEHDTFLDPDRLPATGGASLVEVLVPEADSSVSPQRVRQLLAGIGYGPTVPDDSVAIGADGHWRLAGSYGSWAKPEIEHIGAAARERRRQRRIAECEQVIAEHDDALATVDEELRLLAERRTRLDSELHGRPAHTEVDEARRAVDAAEATVAASDSVVRDATAKVDARERATDETLRALTAVAADHGLPTEREKLDVVAEAVANFAELAQTWLDRHGEWQAARQQARTMAEYAERSASNAAERAETAEVEEATARDLSQQLAAQEETAGADYRDVLAKIDVARREHGDAKHAVEAAGSTLYELAGTIAASNERRKMDAQRRDEAHAERDNAAARFRTLATGSLPGDAGITLGLTTSDGVRATLEAARAVAEQWRDIPHANNNVEDALRRLFETVHACRDTLSRRAELLLEQHEDVHIFTASMDGVRLSASELVSTLRGEAERGRTDITDRERELFDKTLTGDTRRHLADRIRQAGELVDAMNDRLERVQTASRVTVRLVWQVAPDLPAGTKEARELLLKDPVRLSDEDRESLHRFFRERIEQARAENTAASWEQQLAQVFDYTAWHQFVVKIDRADDSGWQLLTKRLHGALSGGEKAIALHLPLFAAVAAHYRTVPNAPRLILLDEVFVGVDATNRGQVFELLSSLGLDLVLTSDHEWCMYSELDGIAIHQLITDNVDDAVTTTRFTWDGAELANEDEQ